MPERHADRRPRRLTGPRGAVTSVVVLAAATVGATGLSAAANSLPAPLQRHVADLSHLYLPFDFPQPRGVLDREPVRPDGTVSGSAPLAPPAPLAERTPREDVRVPTAPTRGDTDRTPLPSETVAEGRASASTRDRAATPARPSTAPSPTPSPSASPSPSSRPSGGTSSPPRSPSSDGSEPRGDGSTSPRRGSSASAGPSLASAAPRPGRPAATSAGPSTSDEATPGKGQGKGKGAGRDQGKGRGGPDRNLVEEHRESIPSTPPGTALDLGPVTGPVDGLVDRLSGSLPTD